MSSINAHHQEEIAKFLKCFRSRLKTHLENIDAEFEDTRSDRLSSDEVYSQKDIKDVLQSLCFAVKANVRSELQDSINMMALLLRQIFSDSERANLMLELDVGQVEDKDLLAKVEKLSVADWAGKTPSSSKRIAVGPSERQQKQQEEEIRNALHTNKIQQEEHAKEMKRINRQLQQARETIEELERKVEDATQHLSQTSQFQSMKKMVTQKNTQLAALRRRLQQYEPDYDQDETKNADEDD